MVFAVLDNNGQMRFRINHTFNPEGALVMCREIAKDAALTEPDKGPYYVAKIVEVHRLVL